MTPRRSFYRKVAYLAVIAAFLLVLNWLFRPATAMPGAAGDPGGRMAQVRQQYHLGQTYLGEVDPTSETIKLVTLGMRGIAANVLWSKSTEYHKKKDWTNLAATLKQVAKLQPNFVSVWEFQAWNIAFNVSVEFDDYRQRYRWVIKGLDYLREGMKYNEREALLPSTMGWFIGQKIGRSDEKKQFRRMFKEDDDFHGNRPMAERDNWLVARLWHQAAEELVEHGGIMRRQGPLLYRSHTPMCLMNYADNLEKDGLFGDVAKLAWRAAASGWDRFGMLELPSYFVKVVRLGEKEMYQARAEKLRNELESLSPGLRAKLTAEKLARLTPQQRDTLAMPAEKLNASQSELAAEARSSLVVKHSEVARRVPIENRAKAEMAAAELEHAEEMVNAITHEREIVNYDYWRLRAQVEQTPELLAAREATYRGDRHYAEGDPLAARKSYEVGLAAWRKVLDRFPRLVTDRSTDDDLMDVIKHYRRTLDQLDEPFPKKFILQDIVDQNELRQPPPEKRK
jgi:tetratricopeptide (TPR) repeat protein